MVFKSKTVGDSSICTKQEQKDNQNNKTKYNKSRSALMSNPSLSLVEMGGGLPLNLGPPAAEEIPLDLYLDAFTIESPKKMSP